MGSVTHHASLTFGADWDIRMGISKATVTITTTTASIRMLIVRWSNNTNTQAKCTWCSTSHKTEKDDPVFYIAFFLSPTCFCLKGQKKLFSWLCLFVVVLAKEGGYTTKTSQKNTAKVWFGVCFRCYTSVMRSVCNRCVHSHLKAIYYSWTHFVISIDL